MEHATLQSELDAFHAEYLARVGVIDVQLQELQAKLAEGTPEAETARRRFRETTTAMGAIPAPAGPPPSDDLKTLFRDAAKRIHPDLQQDASGREHAEAFMKQLNGAYSKGDAEAIGNLVRQWETSPYAVGGAPAAGPAPALVAAVEQAEQRLAETRDSDLARLMEQAFMASMHGQDLLQELRWQAEEALAEARIRVALAVGRVELLHERPGVLAPGRVLLQVGVDALGGVAEERLEVLGRRRRGHGHGRHRRGRLAEAPLRRLGLRGALGEPGLELLHLHIDHTDPGQVVGMERLQLTLQRRMLHLELREPVAQVRCGHGPDRSAG